MTRKTRIFSVSLIAMLAATANGMVFANIVSKTYVDSRVEGISLLAGPQGPQGEIGAQGPQGIQGLIGPQGADGATGPQGLTGPQGTTGPQGADGATGSVSSVVTSGTGYVVSGVSGTSTLTVTKSNVRIPVGSETATTYATIWVE